MPLSDVVAIGIDQSLIGTAIAVVQDGEVLYFHGWTDKKKLQERNADLLSFFSLKAKTVQERTARIEFVADWINSVVDVWKDCYTPYVAIEGYALSRLSASASDLHELGGRIKSDLWHGRTPFRIYNPKTLKMAWTNNGAAQKEEMIECCEDLCGIDLEPFGAARDNIADAILIAQLLWLELKVKVGTGSLISLPRSVRKAFSRVTKAEPVSLLHRPFTVGAELVSPIYGNRAFGC